METLERRGRDGSYLALAGRAPSESGSGVDLLSLGGSSVGEDAAVGAACRLQIEDGPPPFPAHLVRRGPLGWTRHVVVGLGDRTRRTFAVEHCSNATLLATVVLAVCIVLFVAFFGGL